MAMPASRGFCFGVSSAVDAAGGAADRVVISSMASSAYDDFNERCARRCADEVDDARAECYADKVCDIPSRVNGEFDLVRTSSHVHDRGHRNALSAASAARIQPIVFGI